MTQPTRSRAQIDPGRKRSRDLSPPPLPEPLPIPVTDNHVHLDITDGNGLSVDELLAAAAAVNVGTGVQIGCDLPGARWTRAALDRRPQLLGGVAIHPNEAAALHITGGTAALDAAIAEIDDLLDHPRMRVVGETGLDRFRTGPEGTQAQEYSFRRHIDIAKRRGLALQIHDRDAHEDVLRVLAEEGAPERTVLHCFSGDVAMARQCADAGYYMSFAGVVSFTNARPLREALQQVPLDLLLVESDAPFLTPHPYRGRPNASYLVPLTVRAMAEVRQADLNELCTAIAANTRRVYGSWGE